MKTDEIPDAAPSPWKPETNPLRLAVLSKLVEELTECASIAARCIAQGLDEVHPVTGVPNRLALEEELADVDALVIGAMQRLRLDHKHVYARSDKKHAYGGKWFDTFPPEPAK